MKMIDIESSEGIITIRKKIDELKDRADCIDMALGADIGGTGITEGFILVGINPYRNFGYTKTYSGSFKSYCLSSYEMSIDGCQGICFAG